MAEYTEQELGAAPESSMSGVAAPLASILLTEELARRPSRPPDFENENRALIALVSALADSPRTILQTLATDFTLATRATLPEAQFTALHQRLETLQTALTSIWPLVRMPTEHPLVPFVLVAQEQLAALRGSPALLSGLLPSRSDRRSSSLRRICSHRSTHRATCR